MLSDRRKFRPVWKRLETERGVAVSPANSVFGLMPSPPMFSVRFRPVWLTRTP